MTDIKYTTSALCSFTVNFQVSHRIYFYLANKTVIFIFVNLTKYT